MSLKMYGSVRVVACLGAMLAACSDDGGGGTTDGPSSPVTLSPSAGSSTGPTEAGPTEAGPTGDPSGTQGTQGTADTGVTDTAATVTGTDTDSLTGPGTTTDPDTTQGTTGTDSGDSPLDISPDDVVLEIVDGVIVTQDFTVTIDGQDVTSQVTWSYNEPQIGQMGGATFLPNGATAGIGTLKAFYGAEEDSTTVAVKIVKTLDPEGLGPFDAPVGPDPSMSIVYPYDQTVFPLRVAAPVVQWNGVQAGDQYKLHIQEQYYDYTIYFSTSTPARHLIDEIEWTAITESGQGANGDPLTVELQRRSGGTLYQPVVQTWKIAQARLPGRVYYWELPDQCGAGNGKVLSIKPTEAAATPFFNTGACWGCHTVSRDGRRVAAVYDGNPMSTFTIDVSVDPGVQAEITPANGVKGTFAAFNHDGTKIVQTFPGTSASLLKIFDGMTGTLLNGDVMGPGCGEPAWSPDGLKIAAICGYMGGYWSFDANVGELRIGDVQPDGVTVGNVQTIVAQGNGDPGRPAYPNFSPGNEWLVYGRPTVGARSTGNGKLYMVGVDGQNNKRLDIASGDDRSFNPTFAPLRAGGYFWVVFMSRRDYGNTLVGSNRQQLWMTAISDPPEALPDPSNPPFYVRGQEDCAKSENAYFAPDPCKDDGEVGCESGIDCCSGNCVQVGDVKTCGEDMGMCAEAGNACTVDGDCCDPQTPCVDGFCQEIFPG